MTPIMIYIYIVFLGMCIGSFLNVCIYRLPKDQSIVRPASSCPVCNTAIRWYDNIPVISYIYLRGRCRKCRTPIPIRYLIVEGLTGLFAWVTYLEFGFSFASIVYFIFIAALLVITFIDIDHRIIPDIISLPGVAIGIIVSFWLPTHHWLDALLGILAGAGSLTLIAIGYQVIRRKEGMGGGDIKLLAMIGAFIGWKGVLFTMMASSFTGTLVGMVMMMRTGKGMKTAIPFGPFLAFGAILYLFLGPQIIHWYFGAN